MIKLLQSGAVIFLTLILSGCGAERGTGAGSPAESDQGTQKIGELISQSGIRDLTPGEDTDEDAERYAALEEESETADSLLDEKRGEEVDAPAEKTSDGQTGTSIEETLSEGADDPGDNGSEPADIAFTIDTTEGNWYSTPEKRLFSRETASRTQGKIKTLRSHITALRRQVRKGALSRKEGREQTAELRKKISALREIIGSGGAVQRGIHTYQADESLNLLLQNADAGWYRLAATAKNFGSLPEGYGSFSMTLLDKSSETVAGNFSIAARENVYSRGRLIFHIKEPGSRTLDLVWNNDARDEKGDANIQIKSLGLKKIEKPRFSSRRILRGDQYSYLDGRWFFEDQNAYTFHANQTIGYTFYNLAGGTYRLAITVKNRGEAGLPKDYEGFRIEINTNNNSDELIVPAGDTEWKRGKTSLILPEGDATIYLTWLNDAFMKGEYDTNLSLKMISLKGTSPSNLAAYLMITTTGNRMIILIILAALLLIIALASLVSGRKKPQSSSL